MAVLTGPASATVPPVELELLTVPVFSPTSAPTNDVPLTFMPVRLRSLMLPAFVANNPTSVVPLMVPLESTCPRPSKAPVAARLVMGVKLPSEKSASSA